MDHFLNIGNKHFKYDESESISSFITLTSYKITIRYYILMEIKIWKWENEHLRRTDYNCMSSWMGLIIRAAHDFIYPRLIAFVTDSLKWKFDLNFKLLASKTLTFHFIIRQKIIWWSVPERHTNKWFGWRFRNPRNCKHPNALNMQILKTISPFYKPSVILIH